MIEQNVRSTEITGKLTKLMMFDFRLNIRIMGVQSQIDCCANPFQLQCHLQKKGLRHPSPNMIVLIPQLSRADFVCDYCRKRISSLKAQRSTHFDGTGKVLFYTFYITKQKLESLLRM